MKLLDTNNTISKEILYEINKEHEFLITQKNDLHQFVKNIQQKIENIKLPNLSNYLYSHFTNTEKKGIHKCNLCNVYTSNTLKGNG